MDTQIIAVFCICDDILKGLHHYEDPQCTMSDAEVLTGGYRRRSAAGKHALPGLLSQVGWRLRRAA